MGAYLRLKLHVWVVVDYAETRFLNFVIKYLCENEKIRETVLGCSFGAQVKSFVQNNISRKSRDTVSFSTKSSSEKII